MTLHKDGDDRYLECEECPTTTGMFASDEFDMMISIAKAAGWEIKLVGHENRLRGEGSFTHTCPDCKGGNRLARQRALFR